jgi:hypothetical protein
MHVVKQQAMCGIDDLHERQSIARSAALAARTALTHHARLGVAPEF